MYIQYGCMQTLRMQLLRARIGVCKTGMKQAHYQLKHKVQNTAGGNLNKTT